MSFRVSLLFLTVVVVCGQKRRIAKEEWNYRDGCKWIYVFLFNKTHTGWFNVCWYTIRISQFLVQMNLIKMPMILHFWSSAEKVNMQGAANLTQVLDDWRFDILNQVKGLLQNDHQSLLPDYSRYTFMRFYQTLRFSHYFFPQTENSRNTTLLLW